MAIKKQRVYAKNVAVDVFYKRDLDMSIPHQAVVILTGFPDFNGPSAITNFFAENGKIVFHPHIMGTYDSTGEFCPESVQITLTLLNELIWSARASAYPNQVENDCPWKCKSLILVGHSFGGIIALRYYAYLKGISCLILTSPALHYSNKYGCKENGSEHYEHVRKAYPYVYRLAPIEKWEGILSGTDEIPKNPIGRIDNILILYGEKDKYFDLAAVQQTVHLLVSSYIETNQLTLKILKDSGHPIAELLQCSDARTSILFACEGK